MKMDFLTIIFSAECRNRLLGPDGWFRKYFEFLTIIFMEARRPDLEVQNKEERLINSVRKQMEQKKIVASNK